MWGRYDSRTISTLVVHGSIVFRFQRFVDLLTTAHTGGTVHAPWYKNTSPLVHFFGSSEYHYHLRFYLLPQSAMVSKARHDAVPGFTSIAPTIWEYIPTLPLGVRTLEQAVDAPSLIVLFPWTGAQGRHVAKYTMTYQTLFPTTPMLVITTSTKDLCIRTSKRKQDRLRPAIERVLSSHDDSNILVHAFSEGGSNKAVEFAEAYHTITGTRLPCTSLCLDSTLGHPRYLRMCNALRKSLPPSPVLRGVGLLFGGAFLGVMWTLYCCFIGYFNNCISRTRGRIIDPQFWDPLTPRCYLYSEADEVIDSRDIREHIEESAALDIPVMDVHFEGSDHCRHVVENPERYWNAVLQNWPRCTPEKQSAMDDRFCVGQVIDLPDKVYLEGNLSNVGSERTLSHNEMMSVAV